MSSTVQLVNLESRSSVVFDSIDAAMEWVWRAALAEGATEATVEKWGPQGDRVHYVVNGARVTWLILPGPPPIDRASDRGAE